MQIFFNCMIIVSGSAHTYMYPRSTSKFITGQCCHFNNKETDFASTFSLFKLHTHEDCSTDYHAVAEIWDIKNQRGQLETSFFNKTVLQSNYLYMYVNYNTHTPGVYLHPSHSKCLRM